MSQTVLRRAVLRAATTLGAAALVWSATSGATAAQEDRSSVTIGYAVSLSGSNAGGAGITTIPNYRLWVEDVNAAGGLLLPDGSRLPIEVVEYDDRSSAEEAVRAVERLATQDEVDFILPPWGTGFNLAIAPLMARFGYPQIAVTAVTDRAPEFVDRWPSSFWLLGGGADYATALAAVMTEARDAGTINNQVAMISVADGFGIDLVNAARPALTEAGFELVYDEVFPIGTSDFATIVNEARGSGADSFVAFSYPPHTFALAQQAQVVDFSPPLFYLGVGTAFPVFQNMNGENVEGVMGIGGIDPDNPANAAYRERHQEMIGAPADSWASVVTYASLEMLQQAIERVGLDREAVTQELATGTFETAAGTITLENNQLRDLWWVGQWQGGEFVAVAPADREGASEPQLPKPGWN